VIENGSILNRHFSADLLQQIVPIIREIKCTPEEILILEGDLDDCSIFFVEQGRVEIYLEKNRLEHFSTCPLQPFEKGSCFGELEFFTGEHRKFNV